MQYTVPDVKAEGLPVPAPIVAAILMMDYECVGEVVRNMVLWLAGSPEEEKVAVESALVLAVWKAMVRQERGEAQTFGVPAGGSDGEE